MNREMQFRHIVLAILDRPDFDQAVLARRLGTTQPTISRWIHPEKPSSPRVEHYQAVVDLAESLGMKPTEPPSSAPRERPVRQLAVEPVDNARTVDAADVPVLGFCIGGDDGEFTFNGEIIEYIRRPYGLRSVRRVYALYVSSDSMAPRHEPGDIIYVNPDRQPVPGDDVVIEFLGEDGAPGPGYIKRLIKRTPLQIIAEQYNPPRRIEFETGLLKSIHRIVPWREAMGI